jgi:hypothetical protein
MRPALVLAGFLLVAPVDRALAQPTPTAVISGQVGDAETGRPLSRVSVGLGVASIAGQFTDDQGAFEFRNVPPGHYTVQLIKPGFEPAQFPEQRRGYPYRTLEIAPGARVGDLRIPMRRNGALAGRVTDEFGEPAEGARVVLRVFPGGRRPSRPFERLETRTNDLGEFRIAPVPAGQYQLSARTDVSVEPWPGFPTRDAGFVAWPQASAIEHAEPLTLAAGEQKDGIELQLFASKPVKVSGVVLGLDERTMVGQSVSITMVGDDEEVSGLGGGGARIVGGRFETLLAPGDYEIEATAFEHNPADTRSVGRRFNSEVVRVTVGSEPVEDLTLHLTPLVPLTGRIVFDGDGAARPPEPASLRIHGGGFGRCGFQQSEVRPDYTFTVVVHGRRCQAGVSAANPWRVRSVRAGGRDITFEGFDAPARSSTEPFVITMTNRTSGLRVAVADEKGSRAEAFIAFVFPAEPARQASPVRRGSGMSVRLQRELEPPPPGEELSVGDLMAGEYLVAAIRPEDYEASGFPERLERLTAIAQRVALVEGETRWISITVTALPAEHP